MSTSKKQVTNFLEAFQKGIMHIAKTKQELKFIGFLSIKTVYKAAKKVRNPKTGEVMMSEPKYVTQIVPSSAIKGAANSAKKTAAKKKAVVKKKTA